MTDTFREPDWVMVGCRDPINHRYHVFGSTDMATVELVARAAVDPSLLHGHRAPLHSFALTADLRAVAHGTGWDYAEAIRDLFTGWNADAQGHYTSLPPGLRPLPPGTDVD